MQRRMKERIAHERDVQSNIKPNEPVLCADSLSKRWWKWCFSHKPSARRQWARAGLIAYVEGAERLVQAPRRQSGTSGLLLTRMAEDKNLELNLKPNLGILWLLL